MIYNLPKNFFSALPGASKPKIVACSYRNKARVDFYEAIKACEKTFDFFLPKHCSLIASLNQDKKWSPLVFHWIRHLNLAMEAEDIDGCLDILADISSHSDFSALYCDSLKVDSILSGSPFTNGWEKVEIKSLRQKEILDSKGQESIIRPILDQYILNKHVAYVKKALEVIKAVDPIFFEEIDEYLTNINLFLGQGLVGASHTNHMGGVFLRMHSSDVEMDPVQYYIEHITHETSHQQLLQLMAHDKVLLNDRTRRYPAPIRSDLRPMWGIFHATFVLSRMVRVFRGVIDKNVLEVSSNKVYDKMCKMFENGLETVLNHGQLTPNGELILRSLKKCAYEASI
jgi:hypothetical protein